MSIGRPHLEQNNSLKYIWSISFSVGKCISTKMCRKDPEVRKLSRYARQKSGALREDVTDQYKHPEGNHYSCLIHFHNMSGCLYCVRGVWRPLVSILHNINIRAVPI